MVIEAETICHGRNLSYAMVSIPPPPKSEILRTTLKARLKKLAGPLSVSSAKRAVVLPAPKKTTIAS